MNSIYYHLKRAEVYCYINKLRRLNQPETALDYLIQQSYKFNLRKAWAELKNINNG